MCWVEWDLLLYKEVQCGPQFMWSPEDCSLSFQEFLRSSCWSISSYWSTMAFRSDCSLLLGEKVQFVIFCTTIEVQRSTCRKLNCFLKVENRDGLKGDDLVDEAAGDEFVLFWEIAALLVEEAFPCFWGWDSRASFPAYLYYQEYSERVKIDVYNVGKFYKILESIFLLNLTRNLQLTHILLN